MLKTCSKCDTDKPTSEYFIKDGKTGRLHAQCKECYKTHRRTYYSEHYNKYGDKYRERARTRREKEKSTFRTNMLSYLSDKACVVCNENDPCVLELDHIDPAQKSFPISQALRMGYKWEDVVLELQKCQVLCANCHKRRTAQQFGWYKANLLEAPTGIEPA